MASTDPPQQGVSIGVAARALHTTTRALRFYESTGLLQPARFGEGEHRRYEPMDIRRAQRILALRRLGLSVEEVRGLILKEKNPIDLLRSHVERIDYELAELGQLRSRIDALLACPADSEGEHLALDLLEEISLRVVLSKIYTRTGDRGDTAVGGGTRIRKTDDRLEVLGDVDEVVSAIGVAIASSDSEDAELLRSLQQDLFDVGADIASTRGTPLVTQDFISRLETVCDEVNATLEPPTSFVLPGSGQASAALHHARAICRRAERHAWGAPATPDLVRRYLNRLSDLLFILARAAEPHAEPTWRRSHESTLS